MAEWEWTEETIVAEFKKHLPFWQEKLRLRDLDFRVEVVDPTGGDTAWCVITPDHEGSNHSAAALFIIRGRYSAATPFEVWSTVAHELVHAMNWSMAQAFEPLTDHFSTSQINMAKALMKNGNELLAYKWEAILVDWFRADAPPKTRPIEEAHG